MTKSPQQSLLSEIQLAAQKLRRGHKAEALLAYENIAARSGDFAEVNRRLGHLCLDLDKLDDAEKHLRKAIDADPANAEYLAELGTTLQRDSRNSEARELFNRALEVDASNYLAQFGLGNAYLAEKDFARAKPHLENSVRLRPGSAEARANLALALTALNDHDRALREAEKAIKQDGKLAFAFYHKAQILLELGQQDEAIAFLEKTIAKHPGFGGAYSLLAGAKKFTDADESFIDRTEKKLEHGMPPVDRFNFHFALGKMHDDRGRRDKAFHHFERANILQKKPYDLDSTRKRFHLFRKTFDAETIQALRVHGHPTAEPVFIVGMPRSGTTLMERLIAAHPDGAGAGELSDLSRLTEEMLPDLRGRSSVRTLRKKLTPEAIQSCAEEYLTALRRGHEGAERIVDKMPGNYAYIGFISVLFPNATIINAIRNPLDACLSCYFQNFSQVPWANDFPVIADVYAIYRRYMDHWRKVLPEGRIIDIRYEALIDDPQTEGRRLVEGCGLDWDVRSLDFHRQKGIVKTASLWQVRQPIYKTSKRRWVNYAPHIGELADALAPYLEEERELLAEHGIAPGAGARGGWVKRMFG